MLKEKEVEHDRQQRELRNHIESIENTNNSKTRECQVLEDNVLKLKSHLKEKEDQIGKCSRQQKLQADELQSLKQTITSANEQIKSKVIVLNHQCSFHITHHMLI